MNLPARRCGVSAGPAPAPEPVLAAVTGCVLSYPFSRRFMAKPRSRDGRFADPTLLAAPDLPCYASRMEWIGIALGEQVPRNPADQAANLAHRWRDKLEENCSLRMQELGIPGDMNGEPDYDEGTESRHPQFSARAAIGVRSLACRLARPVRTRSAGISAFISSRC
jgi:hypothetical protein